MHTTPVVFFWFRRDLRLDDNVGLWAALSYAQQHNITVVLLFMFDRTILDSLDSTGVRASFIYDRNPPIHEELQALGRVCLYCTADPQSSAKCSVRCKL